MHPTEESKPKIESNAKEVFIGVPQSTLQILAMDDENEIERRKNKQTE